MPADKSRRCGYGCRYDSGSNTSLTEWKTIFALCFSPICLVFISRKGKGIRENFPPYPFLGGLLPLAAVHQEGAATCARDFGGKKKKTLSHQSSTGSWLLLLSHLSWCDWLCCDAWINPNFFVSSSSWLTSAFSLFSPLQAIERKAGKDQL